MNFKTVRFMQSMVVAASFFFLSCDKDPAVAKFYKASRNDTTAVLSLSITNGHFYGKYKIGFVNNGYSGEVRGQQSGDTLTGRFTFPVANGTYKVSPFVVLKCDDNLVLASGATGSYLNIPYYDKASVRFDSDNLQFQPITQQEAEAAFGKP